MTIDEKIYATAVADGMPDQLALFIVAQARHETGNYTSRFFIVGHNAFGYSYVSGAKWQLPDPGPIADNGQRIAQYATVDNSVHELTAWIKRRQNEGKFPADLTTISTPNQYATLLKNSGYYGASLTAYAQALENWVRKILDEQVLTAKTGGIALIVAILIVMFRKKIFRTPR